MDTMTRSSIIYLFPTDFKCLFMTQLPNIFLSPPPLSLIEFFSYQKEERKTSSKFHDARHLYVIIPINGQITSVADVINVMTMLMTGKCNTRLVK